MSAKKFKARNTIEAIRLVKNSLGDDAIILSNRNINGEVEIVAISSNDIDVVTETAKKVEEVKEKPIKQKEIEIIDEHILDIEDFCGEITGELPKKKKVEMVEEIEIEEETISDFDLIFQKNTKELTTPTMEGSQAKTLVENLQKYQKIHNKQNEIEEKKEDFNEDNKEQNKEQNLPLEVLLELRFLRKIVANNVNKKSKQDIVKINLLKKLLLMNFTPSVAFSIINKIPNNIEYIEAETLIKNQINKLMKIIKVEDEIITKGGVYALIGPTGVGKTTTVAKLASRAIIKLGSENVALITTDNYRIAAHQQLKIYADLLGIPIILVENEKEFHFAINKFSDKQLTLIDTTGMSQKDVAVKGLVNMLNKDSIYKLLLLPASARTEILDDIIKSYSIGEISGCILTKEDETEGVMNVIDTLIRHDLPLYYVCNGQRVPEDIVFPNKKTLINKSFSMFNEENLKNITELELALLMSQYSID